MAKKIDKEVENGKVKISAYLVQLFSTLCLSFLCSLTGFVFAWPSYTLENFNSNNTVLSWPLSTVEQSILGSITNIGALVATPFCGYALNMFGRKYSAMLFGIPFVTAWLIISMTNYVPLIIASIGLAGLGAAGQAVVSVYISEISQDSIRGSLTSTTITGYFFGLMFSYILGGRLTYYQVIFSHLSLAILYVVLLMLLKESPVFLVQKGRDEEAARSIAFYRRVDPQSKEVESEINKIKMQLNPQIEDIELVGIDPGAVKSLLGESAPPKPDSSWTFLKNSKSTKRALCTAIILIISNIMMGAVVLQVYAETIFKEATPTMPPNLCSILMALDCGISGMICSGLVDKFGRKPLMTLTSIGTGVVVFLLATQLHLKYAPAWVTAVFIYLYCFIYNIGISIVPYVFTAEVFLPQVRGLCNSITMSFTWIAYFVCLCFFNPLVDRFGLGQVFYGFSSVCFFTAAYSHFCVPETKGLSADAIQFLFLKEKSVKPCQKN